MKRKKILLTGGSGFLGVSLQKLLPVYDWQVLSSDLLDYESLGKEIQQKDFDLVFHLAAISDLKNCEENPLKALKVNCLATFQLALLIAEKKSDIPLVFFSTGQVYKETESGELSEDVSCDPRSLYAKNKLLAEHLLVELPVEVLDKIIILRLFNHTHKSQDARFFLPAVYQQLMVSKNSQDRFVQLQLGNLQVKRDIGSVFDFVAAMGKLIENVHELPNREIFNLSSGASYKLEDLVYSLANKLGLKIEVKLDSSKLRSNEKSVIIGKSQKFQNRMNWRPRVNNPELLIEDFLKEI